MDGLLAVILIMMLVFVIVIVKVRENRRPDDLEDDLRQAQERHELNILMYADFEREQSAFKGERERMQAREQEERNEETFRELSKSILDKSCELIGEHRFALKRNRLRKIRRDDYGLLIKDAWIEEFNYFYNNLILKDGLIVDNLIRIERDYGVDVLNAAKVDFFNVCFDYVESFLERDESDSFFKVSDGDDYEVYCGDVLKGAGWSVDFTPATGDQGVDLIARKNGASVAIQCKYYSSPVGNAAVQEVVAGKLFYGADFSVVVSSSRYTRSARELASISNVVLLHHEQLSSLDDFLK